MSHVLFNKLTPAIMQSFAKRTIAKARWKGPLKVIRNNLIKPILLGEVNVPDEIKSEAFTLQTLLSQRLSELPNQRPKPSCIKLINGEEGEIDGAEVGQPNVAGISIPAGLKRNNSGLSVRYENGLTFIIVAGGSKTLDRVASTLALKEIDDHFKMTIDKETFSYAEALNLAYDQIVIRSSSIETRVASALINWNTAIVATTEKVPVCLYRKSEKNVHVFDKPTLIRPLGYQLKDRDQDFHVDSPPAQGQLEDGDVLILGSTALTALSPTDIKKILIKNADQSPKTIEQALTKAVLRKIKKDSAKVNLTIAVYKHVKVEEIPEVEVSFGEEGTVVTEVESKAESKEELVDAATKFLNLSEEERAKLAQALDKSADYQAAIQKAAHVIAGYSKENEELASKNRYLSSEVGALKTKLERTEAELKNAKEASGERMDQELAPLLGLLKGETKDKRELLKSIRRGKFDSIINGRELEVIELIARGCKGELAEEAKAAIDFVNVDVEEA
ncbi:MAG: hypothetical protein V3T21_05980 [Candidatus Margulisiibacteriota bacterium]